MWHDDEQEDIDNQNPIYDYIDDNRSDLVKWFIEDNKELYDDFRKLYAEDVADDGDFIDSESDLFYRFCEQEYDNYLDVEETKRDLRR